MDERRAGRAVRALRLRRGLRQVDVAQRAGVPQATVSLIERGKVTRLQVGTVKAVVEAVGAEWAIDLRWRGADLDRLMDARHAELVATTMRRLDGCGWTVRPEVSYSVYGERGSIDILGWHAATHTLLVVEVKTAIGALEEMLRRHDAKARLAPGVAARELGWHTKVASRLLVMPDLATPRRHVARADTVLATAYPMRGIQLRRWLREPEGPVSGLLFLSPIAPRDGIQRPSALGRVRRRPGRHGTGREASLIVQSDA
jgi:transcriptional regulator with XRE-family HTH domain